MKCPLCRKAIPSRANYCPYCGLSLPEPGAEQKPRKNTHAARGQGYVFKRGNSWYVRVRKSVYPPLDPDTRSQPKPKTVERTKGGFPTRQAAAAYASQLFGKPKSERSLSLAYYWNVYQTDTLPTLSTSKQTNYKKAFERLEPISLVPVKELSVQDVRSLMDKLHLTYYPAHDIKVVLSKLYDLAYADDQSVSRDIPKMVVLPPKNEKEQDAFTPQEIFNIYDLYSSGNHTAGLILIMIYTSMMPGELLRLTPAMIDLPSLTIRNAGLKTSSRKQSVIAFPAFISPILDKLIQQAPSTDSPVCRFPNYDSFARSYYQTLALAGCRRLVPYSCRHTTQTVLALDPSVSQAQRAAAMRHSIRMEDRYTHIQSYQAKQAIQKMPPPDKLLSSH